MEFKDYVKKYYLEENYNCSESLIHAANEYYGIDISFDDMKMFGGFGSGMYAGIVCGTLVASVAIVSKMLIKDRAKLESAVITPTINKMVKAFNEKLGGNSCRELRPKYYSKEYSCLNTVLLASEILEETVKEIKENEVC